MKRLVFVFILEILTLFSIFSQKKVEEEVQIVYNETFEQAKELFGLNRPEEAIPLFEQIIEEKNIDPSLWIYLGVAYYQVGDFPKSYSTCTKGLALAGTDHKILAFNAGNSAYALGNYARADACYAIAIKQDENFAPAYLNRANAQLKQDHLQNSKTNYEKFLKISPDDEQAEKIQYLITLLEEEIVRRANQKPEIIDPDDFIENRKMEIPVAPEKIEYESPDEIVDEEIVVLDELIVDEAIAPEINPDELLFKDGKTTFEDTSIQEVVTAETLPPENDVIEDIQVKEEVIDNAELPDFVEPKVEKELEDVEEEDKKAPGYAILFALPSQKAVL